MVASIFAASQFFGGSSEPVVDFYIDPAGSDAAAGTSSAPWATLAPLVTAVNNAADGAVITAYVRTGTYNCTGTFTFGAAANTGVNLTVTIADGTVFDGPAGVDASFINVTGSNVWSMELKGQTVSSTPTWTVQGFDTGTGNGIGMDSVAAVTLTVRQVLSQGNVDGWSCHGTAPVCNVYDSVFKSCSKSAASHVHTAGTMTATNCEFWGNPGGSTLGIYFETTTASVNTTLNNCKFIPTGTVSTERNCDFRNATLNDCQVGSLTVSATLVGSAEINKMNDCYINASWDQNRAVTMTRCYGRAQVRQRNTAIQSIIDHCVFVDSPTGAAVDGFLWRNFDPGSAGDIQITSSLLRGFSTAIGMAYTATDAGYWAASGSISANCCLFGNTTNVDADIITADPGSITNTVTADPQMPGPFNTVVQADYVVGAAGPCIGAGVGGTNIGFAATDI